ncbi:MAG: VOC family protein, partial [Chloroflexi bacterium]|nr:VOC family protein [Chloroflexota bacterium]
MVTYTYDHIHLRSRDPMATAQYFNKMFDAKILESIQSDGQPRIDLDINGLIIFIAKADENTPEGPVEPHLGLDHFGLRVDNLAEAAADLKA